MDREKDKFASKIIEVTDAIEHKDMFTTIKTSLGNSDVLNITYFSIQLANLKSVCKDQVKGGVLASLGITSKSTPYLKKIIDVCDKEIKHLNSINKENTFEETFNTKNVNELKRLNEKLRKSLNEAGKFIDKISKSNKAVLSQEGVSSALKNLANELENQINTNKVFPIEK